MATLELLLGTLVVLIATNDGLVVAADSRSSVGGHICDGVDKIVEVRASQPTVIAVPGMTRLTASRPGEDPCKPENTKVTLFDLPEIVRAYVERYSIPSSREQLLQLAALSMDAVRAARSLHPDAAAALRAFAGRSIYKIVIATYDGWLRQSAVQIVDVFMDAPGIEPRVHEIHTLTFSRTDRRAALFVGIPDYVQREVLAKRPDLVPAFIAFCDSAASIARTSADEAVRAAVNLIEGTAHATQTVPAEHPVGGPARAVLLGSAGAITRLR